MSNKSAYLRIAVVGVSTLISGYFSSIADAAEGIAPEIVPTIQATEIAKSSAEPGRIAQSQMSSMTPTGSVGGPATLLPPPPQGLSPEAAQVSFRLTRIDVTGSTVFTAKELLAPYQAMLGKNVTLGEIEAIAQSMTERYEKAGYIITRVIIPPQYIEKGVVTLQVVEGYVDTVSVEGHVLPSVQKLLLKYGEKVQQSRPLRLSILERYALLANDLPGVSAKIVLRPSKFTPGAADLVFVTQESIVGGYVGFDNLGTRFLGPQEFSAGGSINSLFRAGDSTGVQLLNTANKELDFVQVTHQEPLGSRGLLLTSNAAYTRTLPGSYLSAFEIKGESTTANLGLSYPIIRSRIDNLYGQASLGFLDSRSIILNAQLYSDKIRYANIGLSYDRIDSWHGLNQMGANFTQGLDVFNASQGQDISRPGVSPRFNKFNFNLSRLQPLPYHFSVYVAGQAQDTPHSQYAAEQFGFGGPIFGRGYDPSEILGDRGIEGKGEIRYDIKANQLYVYYDAGDVWNNNRTAQPGQLSATSTGIGVRSNITRYISAFFEVAQPLTRTVAAEHDKSTRYYLGITLAGQNTIGSTSKPMESESSLPPPPGDVAAVNQLLPTRQMVATHARVAVAQPQAQATQFVDKGKNSTLSQPTVQPVFANNVANVADQSIIKKIEQINPDYFTIKLAADRERDSGLYFIKAHKLGDEAFYFPTSTGQGQTRYVLIYGEYPTADAAKAALAKLTETTKLSGAMVTRYADIQDLL